MNPSDKCELERGNDFEKESTRIICIISSSYGRSRLWSEGGSGSGSKRCCFSNSGSTTAAQKTYKVAISQIVEHPSLDATRQGFLAALKEAVS